MASSHEELLNRVSDFLTRMGDSVPELSEVETLLSKLTSSNDVGLISSKKETTGVLLAALLKLCEGQGWEPFDVVRNAFRPKSDIAEKRQLLGRKLNVALLFGRFDPVHRGHIYAAKQVLELGGMDEVWFMPCFEPSSGKTTASAEQRLAMCQMACSEDPRLRVSEFAIENQLRGELQHLLNRFLSEESLMQDCTFSWLLEQDAAERLYQWSNCNGLERLLPFIVLPHPRCQSPGNSAWFIKPPHRFLSKALPSQAFRTAQVRRMLATNDENAESQVAKNVLAYIRENKLYQKVSDLPTKREHRVALYVDKFDPPSIDQRKLVERILESGFDEVVVCPLGAKYPDLDQFDSDPLHRASMVTLAFRNMTGVTIDYDDLSLKRFTTYQELQKKYNPRGAVWHVIPGLRYQEPEMMRIRREWEEGGEPWEAGSFLLIGSKDLQAKWELCSNEQWLATEAIFDSKQLRERAIYGESLEGYVSKEVNDYILRHRVYRSTTRLRHGMSQFNEPRLRIVADARNPKSMAIRKKYEHLESESPDLILVLGGDGTMLHAIREFWEERVPFVGLNTGHLGFLMNEHLPETLNDLELVTYSMPLLRVDCLNEAGERFWGLAFADVWLERAEGQAAWLRVDVDGQTRVNKVVGDGMLIATAAGSSAYARAMGAVPVPLNTPTLTLAGSNIFQPRFWKPMALSDESTITLASLDTVGKRPVRGFIDGNAMGIVREITVRRSLTAGVQIAFTKEFDPSVRLLRSLFPPEEER